MGILTLGWENKSHTSVVFEIKQIMDILKRQNVEIYINWTPGYAEITGNEIADRLAKEAAVDAENMPEVCSPLTSIDSLLPGRVAQSVTCLATDVCLTADPGVASSIPARYHTFVEIDHEIISTVILLPSAD